MAAADGEELLGFAYRFDAPAGASVRTLLLLHGTGGDENDLLELGQAVAPGMALLSPRGKVLENGMPRFFRRLAEGVFDEADLLARTDELAEFIERACTRHGRDPRHVVALGFSNGANIAASLLLKRPDVLEAAVLMRAMVPFEPAKVRKVEGTAVLMLSGLNDPIVSRRQAERLADLLRARGADVTLQWSSGGHGIAQEDLVGAREWMEGLDAPIR